MKLEVACGDVRVNVCLPPSDLRYLALEAAIRAASGWEEPLVCVYRDGEGDSILVVSDDDLFNMQESFKKGDGGPELTCRSLAEFLVQEASKHLARSVIRRYLSSFRQNPGASGSLSCRQWIVGVMRRAGFTPRQIRRFQNAETRRSGDRSQPLPSEPSNASVGVTFTTNKPTNHILSQRKRSRTAREVIFGSDLESVEDQDSDRCLLGLLDAIQTTNFGCRLSKNNSDLGMIMEPAAPGLQNDWLLEPTWDDPDFSTHSIGR